MLDAPLPIEHAWLPAAAAFSLRAAAAHRSPFRELEFELRIDRADPAQLRALLAPLGSTRLPDRVQLTGLLRGFIDAVFEHDGRLWIVDWQWNRLGDAPDDYAPAALGAAMQSSGYRLQAMLYCVALQRRLDLMRPGARALSLGGIAYVFLRGAGLAQAPAGCGFWVERFDPQLVRAVSDALDGRPVRVPTGTHSHANEPAQAPAVGGRA